jgi:hypothetical protein
VSVVLAGTIPPEPHEQVAGFTMGPDAVPFSVVAPGTESQFSFQLRARLTDTTVEPAASVSVHVMVSGFDPEQSGPPQISPMPPLKLASTRLYVVTESQWLPLHNPEEHTAPHAPQLFGSPVRVAQYGAPPSGVQSDWPARQPGLHLLPEQDSPDAQSLPHVPQFALSVVVLAQ